MITFLYSNSISSNSSYVYYPFSSSSTLLSFTFLNLSFSNMYLSDVTFYGLIPFNKSNLLEPLLVIHGV